MLCGGLLNVLVVGGSFGVVVLNEVVLCVLVLLVLGECLCVVY